MPRRLRFALAALSCLLAVAAQAQRPPHFQAPAGSEPARVVPNGVTILPNGRLLTPQGPRLYGGENYFYVALNRAQSVAVGFCDGGMVVHRLAGGPPRRIPLGKFSPGGLFLPDGRLLISNGDEGGIALYDATGWDTLAAADEGKPYATLAQKPLLTIAAGKDGYINDLAVRADGRIAYGVDIARGKLTTFDLAAGRMLDETAAGREPYALALSGDGRRLFIANIGIFDYTLIPSPEPGKGNKRGLSRPPFGFPSRESEVGVHAEGRFVPGVGSPYVPDAQSVWSYDLVDPARPRVAAKAKAGLLIHAPSDRGKAVGGSAPNALLLRGNTLFVSCANNDTVQLFDAATLALKRTVKLTPVPQAAKLRGVIPTGMALSRDGARLYVCEAGLNAVAVIDPRTGKTLGHLPTGWFPVQCQLSADEKTLFVATQKGLGRGPRGKKHERQPGDERYGWPDMPGMLHLLPLPTGAADLADSTRTVLKNNGLTPLPTPLPTLPREIEYVVYIIKENHTFDGIFGGLRGAHGDPDYAEWGVNGWLREKGKDQRLPVMPNHLRLAEQFAISDNFYMEPDASGDGHRWLVGVYPSLWTTRVFYTGWDFRKTPHAPGRFVSFGSNASQIPEDYLENGSLWEHIHRGGIPFRNYGEGFEFPDVDEGQTNERSGAYEVANFPMPKVLYDNTCFDYPIFNMNIPDIFRVDWFIEDLQKQRKAKGKIPRFLTIALCNDHGTGPRPDRGYPYLASWMADNDLALGRLVEYLSHLPEWKKMAIFVTQDDSGGDSDHIDRHRSYVLTISPYAKRGFVTHRHTSIMSIVKTIYLAFGLGPNNLFDALATDLADMFTSRPDLTPYKHVPVDPRVFKPEDTIDPSDPKFERRRKEPSIRLDDPRVIESLRPKD